MPHLSKPIGVLGGTFDPIHFGHLRTAVELCQALDLKEVRIVPCYQPVHRKMPTATPDARLAMVKKAISLESSLKAESCEIDRKGPSYTIDTMTYLREQNPNIPLCLIMGIDALLGFTSWHRWENILEIAHLVVAHRPQYQLPPTGIIADLLKERLLYNSSELHEKLSGHIFLHPVTPLDISATDIRKQISIGRNPRFLLPDEVLNYINEHGTYSISRL